MKNTLNFILLCCFLVTSPNTYLFAKKISKNKHKIKLTIQERRWIRAHHTIKVHNEMNWAPFNYNIKGVPKGFSIDYMNLLAKKLRLKVKYIHGYTWNEFLDLMKKKKIDVMLNILKTKDREKYILFTDNYYISNPTALIIRKNEKINTIQDLFGKKVAITKGFYYEKLLKKDFPKIKQIVVKNDEKSVLAVSTSTVDAAFGKLSVANYYMTKNSLNNIKLVKDKWLTNKNINTKDYIGVRKDWPILQILLNKAMAAVSNKELNKLKTKWSIINGKNDKFKESLNKEETKWIKKHHVIHFVINPSSEPFEYIERYSGKFKGIVKDYIDILSLRTGIKFVLDKTASWEDSIKKIRTKKSDMYSSVSKNKQDLKIMNYSIAYLNYPLVIVTKNNKGFISSIYNLYGKKIAVIRDRHISKYLEKNHQKIKKIYVDDIQQALRAVSEGEAYAFISSLPIVSFQMNKYGYNDLKISGRLYFSSPIYMALRKDWGKTGIQIINKALLTINKEKKEEIYNKHVNIVFEHKVDYSLVWQILALVFLLIVFILLWMRELSKLNRKIKEQKRIFETIYEKAFDAIMLMEDGRFIDCNEYAVKMFGLKNKNEIIMKRPSFSSPMFQPDSSLSSQKSKEMIEKAMQNGHHHFEWLHKRANGENFWADIALTKIALDKKDIIHVRLINIQGEKEAKKEALEAKEKIIKTSRYKSEFLANISHEIRTPMNAIMGFADLLNRELKDEQLKSYARTIKSSGTTLLNLINDVLDLSKIEAGKLTINNNPTDLEKLFNNIIDIFALKVQEKGLSLVLNIDKNIPKVIMIDDIRLRQIVLNLVGNAIKFTKKGHVELNVNIINRHSDTFDMCICVIDTGIGIKNSELENIFESFTQQSGQSLKEYGGTGLGLNISQKLTSMMGGDIKVKSTEGEGSVFELKFYNIKKSLDVLPAQNAEQSAEKIEYERKKVFNLSEKTKENIDVVNKILAKDIMPLYENANKSQDMLEISNFVESIDILAKKYDVEIIKDYVLQINKAIDIFDVEKIKMLLQKFIEIKNSLL